MLARLTELQACARPSATYGAAPGIHLPGPTDDGSTLMDVAVEVHAVLASPQLSRSGPL